MSILRPISFVPETESDLLEHFDSKTNKSQYAKDLIRKDMGLPTLEEILVERVMQLLESRLNGRMLVSLEPTKSIQAEEDFSLEDVKSLMGGM